MPTATTKRPSVTENITVLQIGDFGVRVDEKNWYNTNEPLKPTAFQLNQSYKVSLSVAKSGKKYINEIIGVADATTAVAGQTTDVSDAVKQAEAALAKAKADAEAKVQAEAKAVAAAAQASAGAGVASGKPPYRAGYDKPLSEYDLAKDKQIAKSGIIQAALQSPAIAQWSVDLNNYLENVKKVADFALNYVQG